MVIASATSAWVWIALAVFGCAGNIWYASRSGVEKSAGSCALDAVLQALLAVWIYLVVIH